MRIILLGCMIGFLLAIAPSPLPEPRSLTPSGATIRQHAPQVASPPSVAPTAETSEEGWLVIHGVSEAQMATFCTAVPQRLVLGCAVWSGPLFLSTPAQSCLILIAAGLPSPEAVGVLELEKRHCREGIYHDATNVMISKEIRDALLRYNVPGLTR